MNNKVFVIVLCALFALEWLEQARQGFIQPFTEGLAALSAGLLQIIDADVMANGIVIANRVIGASVAILAGCNGIEAMICLTAIHDLLQMENTNSAPNRNRRSLWMMASRPALLLASSTL